MILKNTYGPLACCSVVKFSMSISFQKNYANERLFSLNVRRKHCNVCPIATTLYSYYSYYSRTVANK